jgi:hypothetical protein
VLELEAADTGQATRLRQGEFFFLEEENGDFLFKFRFGHSGCVKNFIGDNDTHFVVTTQALK